MGGSVQVGEKGSRAGGAHRGAVAAGVQCLVPRPPRILQLGPTPACLAALQEQERGGGGGRVTPAVMGACGAGKGLESVGAGSCPSYTNACTRDFSEPQFPLLSFRLRDHIYWTLETG